MHSVTCEPSSDLPGLRVADVAGDLAGAPETSLWLVTWVPDPPASTLAAWGEALSAAARSRLLTIGTSRGQVRFAASHAALALLSASAQHWSLSHTRWCAAIAGCRQPVGVDLEADLARPLWQVAAATRWPGHPPGQWSDFLDSWVRAEASFKVGAGVAGPCVVRHLTDLGSVPDHLLALAWGPRPGRSPAPNSALAVGRSTLSAEGGTGV